MIEYIFAFLVGGIITTLIIFLEVAGFPTLSRLAALFPIFTWLSYLFIGRISGGSEVSRHSLFVLLGTLVAWIPYMLVIYFLSPRIGPTKAIILALVLFIILALLFTHLYKG